MKLSTTLVLYGGGVGSGCHGSNCGRPHGHETITYKPGEGKEHVINGIPLRPVENPDFKAGTNPHIDEPPFIKIGDKHRSAGVIMVEPDGRIWLCSPQDNYGGYRNTFPKGTLDGGESPQEAAIREVWEETGLVSKITGYLGDFQRTSSVARYYIGERTGGAPWKAGWESGAVKLVKPSKDKVYDLLRDVHGNYTADHDVFDALIQHLEEGAKRVLAAAVQDIWFGGPGSGCRGDHCGRPAGTGHKVYDNLSKTIDYLKEKQGGQLGSNAGGFYKGSDGVDRYVKFYKNPAQGRGEALANSIYRDLGLGAPKSAIFTHKDSEAFASEIISGGKTLEHTGLQTDLCRKVLDGFAADVLVGNWDAVGLTYDNIIVKDGNINRIDNGGTFLIRAQGGWKPDGILNKITEWEAFLNPNINGEYSRLAKKAGYTQAEKIPNIKQQVGTIVKLRDSYGGWDKYLDKKAPFLKGTERTKIVSMLESRTKLLADKVRNL